MVVEPEVIPPTTPVPLTVATAVFVLVQVPPVVASARLAIPPTQNVVVPVIDAGVV